MIGGVHVSGTRSTVNQVHRLGLGTGHIKDDIDTHVRLLTRRPRVLMWRRGRGCHVGFDGGGGSGTEGRQRLGGLGVVGWVEEMTAKLAGGMRRPKEDRDGRR